MSRNIKNIFQSMEYGKCIEDTSMAKVWFNDNPKICDRFTNVDQESYTKLRDINTGDDIPAVIAYKSIGQIYENAAATKKWCTLKNLERAKILNNFANKIAQNADLIGQIEICARGILFRDTKEISIPLLVNYLNFYSNVVANEEAYNSETGLVAAFIGHQFLGCLAFILGPVLAAGHNLVIHTDIGFSFVVYLLIQLSVDAGIPEGTIRLIPCSRRYCRTVADENVNFLTVFGDIDKKTIYICDSLYGEKFLYYTPLKIPAIVFNNADISSACDSLIKSVWNHQGMLPYSVRNIYVQEDILETFIKILKERLKQVKLAASNEKLADITYPDEHNVSLLKQAIETAKQEGIEVYQSGSNENYLPTVFIGGSPDIETKTAPYCVVLGFRTTNEAVNLANNNKQGFGCIVWTENISLANEVCGKLKVSNVWINTEGVLSPSIAFSGYKESGNGYFGGQEGLNEYLLWKPGQQKTTNLRIQPPEDATILNSISSSEKAQASWRNINLNDRIQRLKAAAENFTENCFDELIYKAIFNVSYPFVPNTEKDYIAHTLVEPLGIIAVNADNDRADKIIISAVLMGNSVIIFSQEREIREKYQRLSKVLASSDIPKATVTVLEYTENTVTLLFKHKKVAKIFSDEIQRYQFNKYPHTIYPLVTEWRHILDNVVLKKTVWSTVGQSFI